MITAHHFYKTDATYTGEMRAHVVFFSLCQSMLRLLEKLRNSFGNSLIYGVGTIYQGKMIRTRTLLMSLE